MDPEEILSNISSHTSNFLPDVSDRPTHKKMILTNPLGRVLSPTGGAGCSEDPRILVHGTW